MTQNTPDGAGPPAANTISSWDADYLTARGVPVDFALSQGLRTLTDVEAQRPEDRFGFRRKLPCGGLLIPYETTYDRVTVYRVRLRQTRFVTSPVEGSDHGEVVAEHPKFIATADAAVVPYFPREVSSKVRCDVSIPIFIAEGPVKALALMCLGLHAIGLGGVEAGFHDVAELHATGHLALNKSMAMVDWRGRKVYLVSDAGRVNNPSVARGEARLARLLDEAGAEVSLIELPWANGHDSRELLFDPNDQGPDDYIGRHGGDAFKKLVERAVPASPIERARRCTTAAEVATLLQHLPFQAALAVGGSSAEDLVFDQVRRMQIRRTSVREAVSAFQARVHGRLQRARPEWAKDLRKDRNGAILGTVANVSTILTRDERWSGVLAYNEFSERHVFLKKPPWHADDRGAKPFVEGQEIEDSDDTRLVAWLEREWGVRVSASDASRVVMMSAERRRFHPVREYLNALRWDQQPRIGVGTTLGWLTTYVGAEDSPYVREVGKAWLVSAVARIFVPGCKVDTMLILEGRQGKKKSTVFDVLGGPFFMDDLRDIHNKDACQQLAGKWICEMGELAALSRGETELVKRFVSTRVDNYRPAYGKRNRDFARQIVFCGSTNKEQYLKDETGGRRFHPVRVGNIDIEALRRDRDQLWAEAVHLFRAGERWWFEDDDVIADAEDEQDQRRQRHPWEERIVEQLADQNSTTMAHVLESVLDIKPDRWTRQHESEVGGILHAIGWTKVRRRVRSAGRGTSKQPREYVYVRAGYVLDRNGVAVPTPDEPGDPGRDSAGRDAEDAASDDLTGGVPTVPTSDRSPAATADGRDGFIDLAAPPALGRDGRDGRDTFSKAVESQHDQPSLPPTVPGRDGPSVGTDCDEWVLAHRDSAWMDEVTLSSGDRIPRLTVTLHTEDGREVYGFYGGPKADRMRQFYESVSEVHARIRPHDFNGDPGWLVVAVDDTRLH